MTTQGWVKKHRKVLGTELHQDPLSYWLFDTLLMLAAYSTTYVPWRGRYKALHRGQVWTTVRYLEGLQREMGKSTIHRRLQMLEAAGRIRVESGTDGMLITILNYGLYQSNTPDAGTRTPKKRDDLKKDKNLSHTRTPAPIARQAGPAVPARLARGLVAVGAAVGQAPHPVTRQGVSLHNISFAAPRDVAKNPSKVGAPNPLIVPLRMPTGAARAPVVAKMLGRAPTGFRSSRLPAEAREACDRFYATDFKVQVAPRGRR